MAITNVMDSVLRGVCKLFYIYWFVSLAVEQEECTWKTLHRSFLTLQSFTPTEHTQQWPETRCLLSVRPIGVRLIYSASIHYFCNNYYVNTASIYLYS